MAAAAAAAGESDGAAPQEALLFDFFDQEIPYEQAWAWQRRRVDALASAGPHDRRDSVIILQHPPTYTLGAGSTEDNLRFDPGAPPHPIHRTERGGEVTYHGPGQLVVYPILDLTRHRQDLHWYLRSLEEVVIRALANVSGLEAGRVEGLTGVWVDGAKLCAIGVRARKWVTFHGLALNVVPDLAPFGLIVPCGIGDKPVGSVEGALAREAAAAAAAAAVRGGGDGGGAAARPPWPRPRPAPARASDWDEAQRELLLEYRYALVEALEEVFGLQLVAAGAEEAAALLGVEEASFRSEEAGDGVPEAAAAAAHV